MKELQDKLIRVQAELKAPKSQRNTFGNYNYRSAEDILEAVKPLLIREGLAMTISDDIVECGDRVFVKATATVSFGDSAVSVSAFAREAETKKGMDAAQVTGSASSYARKYALNGLFLIDDTKDADYSNNGKDQQQTAPLVDEYLARFQDAGTIDELKAIFESEYKAAAPENRGAIVSAKNLRKKELA